MPRSVRPMIGRVERLHRLIEELRLRGLPYLSARLLDALLPGPDNGRAGGRDG